MRPRLPVLLFLATLLAATAARGDDPQSAPAPCSGPEHRQFDFWLGEWQVRNPAGKIVGQNRITTMHNGCVLFENWSGNGGVTGSSFNVYDAGRKQWHQSWVDSAGGLLELEGGYADGRMVLKSAPGKAPSEALNRITWQLLPDGRVRQLWETSADNGSTWKTAFDGYYEKAK